MTPQEFVQKWRSSELRERQGSHEHFIDLCRVFRERTPAEADPSGREYCFCPASTTSSAERQLFLPINDIYS